MTGQLAIVYVIRGPQVEGRSKTGVVTETTRQRCLPSGCSQKRQDCAALFDKSSRGFKEGSTALVVEVVVAEICDSALPTDRGISFCALVVRSGIFGCAYRSRVDYWLAWTGKKQSCTYRDRKGERRRWESCAELIDEVR